MSWAESILNNLHLLKQASTAILLVDKEQVIARQYLMHRSSVRNICEEVRHRGMGISKGEVSATLHKYGSLLPVFDTLPNDDIICCLVIDETFQGNNPYLVTIDSRTGYTLCIAKADNRKSETWSFYLEQILAGNKPE